jgi:hypothetical protein
MEVLWGSSMSSDISHIIAEGPEGLKAVLMSLLKQAQNDLQFASREHYILYQLGGQKSVIKVDMSEQPYLFWHYDLLGRPATGAIKDTIAQFLWNECGIKEHYMQGSDNAVTK